MDSLIFGKSLKMSRKIALSARFQRVMLSLDILRISLKLETCDIRKYHNIFIALKIFDKLEV